MFTPEMLWGVGVILLLAALVYGMIQYKTRNRANDRITEEASKALYDDPDHYPEKHDALEKEVRPS